MIRGFYTGTTGAIEHQKAMAVAANNMANVNTDGYKTSNATFQELLYQRIRMPDDYETNRAEYDRRVRLNQGLPAVPNGYDEDEYEYEDRASPVNYFSENKLSVGAGGKLNETALVMTQGAYRNTGSPFDALIKGDAFFAVLDRGSGEIAYTKHGVFAISVEDGDNYLVTPSGEYVLDEYYDRVTLPEDIDRDRLRILPHFSNEEEDEHNIRVGLFTCNNIYGLAHIGDNKYMPTEFSGEMDLETREGVDIIARSVEMSNVSLADEMVKVIQAQRAFQSNLTVIRTADEIEAYINQLRS